MRREKAAPLRERDLARAVAYERQQRPEQARGRVRGRFERAPTAARMRVGAGASAGALPIRPTVIRTHTLSVEGELGHDTATAFEAEIDRLCAAGIDELILDLGALRIVDVTGVVVIAMRVALCRRRGMRVTLVRTKSAVRAALLAAGDTELLGALWAAREAVDEKALRKEQKIVRKG